MKKRRVISVKFYDEELETIDRNAELTGRKRSTYIREVALGNTPKEKPSKEFYEAIKLLRYISNNINQIAKNSNANSSGFVNENKYDEQVVKLNSFIIDIKKKFL